MSSPVANGDAGVIFNCPALTELYGVTASQSLPDGRYVVPAAWRCGGTSGKRQSADGVKASVSLCAILCGIVPSFPTPNVIEPQGISQIPADPHVVHSHAFAAEQRAVDILQGVLSREKTL